MLLIFNRKSVTELVSCITFITNVTTNKIFFIKQLQYICFTNEGVSCGISDTVISKGVPIGVCVCVGGDVTPYPQHLLEICRYFDKMYRKNVLTQCCRYIWSILS